MASFALTAAGAIGGFFVGGPAGIVTGAKIGAALGGVVDGSLFGDDQNIQSGSRLSDLTVSTSTYGKMIPIVYAGRVAANMIWATEKREVKVTQQSSAGGKGGGAGSASSESFEYYVDAAFSLSEGSISGLLKVWADSTLVWDAFDEDNSLDNVEVFLGTPDQEASSVIIADKGLDGTPAYRNQAYFTVQDLFLNPYGGRIPNFQAALVGKLPALWAQEGAQDITYDGEGNIYVVSHLQRSILKADSNLKTIKVLGAADPEDDYLGDYDAHPWRIIYDDSESKLWVTCLCNDTVQKIDPNTGNVDATIDLGVYPYDIVQDNNNNIWVTHPLINKVSKIDAVDNSTSEVVISGEPTSMAVHPTTGNIWLTATNDIVEFNPQTLSIVSRTTLPNNKYFPHGIAYNSADESFWFAVSGNDVIGVIDANTKAINYRNSGTWPFGVSINPNDTKSNVYVSTFFGNRVKVLKRGSDNALVELTEFKTEVWPGPILALEDGRSLVSNTNRGFAQEIPGAT